ncbi:MAG TPA: bacitracin ABC transporter ATP-binding protein [Firmicutes bacterium]|jgi:ABC-type lipoprotein export system ATPase subunit|nr:bacitracin ABC transporter ATP-binding protein [Bacillota bacterium]
MAVLTAHALTKVYGSPKGAATTRALSGLSMEVDAGEFVGVMGPSGSGKTTLLNVLATIDTPTSGTIEIDGISPGKLRGDQLALFRRRQLGFVFQDFNLLNTLSVRENIALPLALDNVRADDIERRVEQIAVRLGISHILDKRTYEISGGEQQRAAIGRAIVPRPAILLADEPTGNLDSKSSHWVMQAFRDLNEKDGATILVVTHDPFVASFCRRIIFIKDGKVFSELRRSVDSRQAFFQKILDSLSLLGGEFNDVAASRI